MPNNKNKELKLENYEKDLIKTGLAKYVDSLQDDYFITENTQEKEYLVEIITDIENLISKLEEN